LIEDYHTKKTNNGRHKITWGREGGSEGVRECRCLSPLILWVRIPIRARCTTLCLLLTCGRPGVFSGSSVFLHQ
jgi:hypothetical protein